MELQKVLVYIQTPLLAGGSEGPPPGKNRLRIRFVRRVDFMQVSR